MFIPHSKLSIDINRPNQYTVDFIAHVGDKNTRYIDITFNADGEPIELEQGCAATVTYVSDGVLIEQEAECDVDGSTVIVGIDTEKVKNLRSGILEIQPKIVDGSGNIIVSQIPVLVRISPDIAEHGRVDDDSLGTYAEVVREIAAARGSYTDLKERLDHTGAPTDEQVAEAVEDYFDEHPISGAEKFVEVTDTSDTAVDNCTAPDTVYIVRVVSGVVTTTKMRVICTPNVAGQMAQYAMTKDGYIISRKFTASEWGAWDFIPDSKRVATMISTAIAGKADSSAIPTKTSQLKNDSGFLTSHQDVSGKENTSNKKTSISNQSQTGDKDTNYPTVGAVRDFVNLVKDDLEDYVDEEIGNIETLLSQV